MSVDALICNLTRFGDLLQTQALIDDLHDSGLSVGLICQNNFSSAVALLNHISFWKGLNGAKILAELDSDWKKALLNLTLFTKEIRKETKPKYIINLGPNLPARLLAKLLSEDGAKIIGFGLDEDGFGYNSGIWASFLAATTRKRVNAPFNIVDMFRKVASPIIKNDLLIRKGSNVLQNPSIDIINKAKNLVENSEKLIGFQLGASEKRRQWPISHFIKVGEKLSEIGYIPVLLGTKNEEELANNYIENSKHKVINLIGKTTAEELSAVLKLCSLLVTNDTGTMHLAAGCGIKSIAIFLATAQPWDTGPYLENCICLEPDINCHPCAFGIACQRNQQCLEKISADTVSSIAFQILDNSYNFDESKFNGSRVWRSDFDEYGFSIVKSLNTDDLRNKWMISQRTFWRQLLDDLDSNKCENLLVDGVMPENVHKILVQALSILKILKEQINIIGKSAKIGQLFLLNCERLQQLLLNCPELVSLGHFWMELRQDRGDKIDNISLFVEKLSLHIENWLNKINIGTPLA